MDWLLHPLKSELNWPLGDRQPLDFSRSATLGSGVRWHLPFHLLDGLFLALHGRAADSRAAEGVSPTAGALSAASGLRAAIERGRAAHDVQLTPHFILLSRPFYDACMLPHLAAWAVEWLGRMGVTSLDADALTRYITTRGVEGLVAPDGSPAIPARSPSFRPLAGGNTPGPPLRGAAATPATPANSAAALRRALSDEQFKLLNLTRDWLLSLLPHVLAKASRVNYGLLSAEELRSHPATPPSRRLLAVPFVGKDVPSASSQFSHPDVVIGLSILSYRRAPAPRSSLCLTPSLPHRRTPASGPPFPRPPLHSPTYPVLPAENEDAPPSETTARTPQVRAAAAARLLAGDSRAPCRAQLAGRPVQAAAGLADLRVVGGGRRWARAWCRVARSADGQPRQPRASSLPRDSPRTRGGRRDGRVRRHASRSA